MFCTNCGEEMRATDKFCANCGTAAAPRPAKTRGAAPVPPEPAASVPAQSPAPVRAPQSTAEAFHAPLPAISTVAGNVKQPELGFSPPARQAQPSAAAPVKQAAPPVKAAPAPQDPVSSQEERQILLEAEELASVRGMVPIDALPDSFPAPAPPPAAPVARTQACTSCGELNPADNRFCERCGQPLQATPVQSAPAPASVRPLAPSPITQTSWLDEPEPVASSVSKPMETAAVSKAAPSPPPVAAAPAAKDDNFFYFYDDSAAHRGNRKLLIVLMVVLALGVLGVIYMLSGPAKHPAGANISISISPTEAQVVAGQAHDFAATVTGSSDTDVTWSVAEGSSGGKVVNHGAQAEGGTVAIMAVYVAPTTPGSYHVVATSKADPAKSATAEVTVTAQ